MHVSGQVAPFFFRLSRVALLALLFASSGGYAIAEDAAAAASTPTDKQLASAKCISGMEKFLPGEYFYCVAAQSYGQNKYRYAEKFFKEAASWASKPAQYVLGIMALNGDQQPVNRPLALAWFALASERHTPRFQQPYDELKSQLGPSELAKADEYLASMKRTYGDDVAAPRAEERYRQGVGRLVGSAAGTTYCMEGVRDFRDLAGPGNDMESMVNSTVATPCAPGEAVAKYVDNQAAQVFEDWSGHVTVGPITTSPTQLRH